MTTEVVVRVMRPDEWPMARDVGIDAFDGDGLPELLDALRASWSWIDELAFVAEVDGAIAGMVLFNRAILDTDDRNVDVLLLSPLGVRRDLQHRGIGSALMRGALDVLAATRPEPAVFLEGIPTYYPRFGFRRAAPAGSAHGFLYSKLEVVSITPGTPPATPGCSGATSAPRRRRRSPTSRPAATPRPPRNCATCGRSRTASAAAMRSATCST